MLDAFIIDRIRREREAAHDHRAPVQIEVPPADPDPQPRTPFESEAERGIIEVDFSI